MSGRPRQSNTRSHAFNARTTPLLPSATRENPAPRPVPAPWESSSQPESHCASASRTGLREALAACLPCLGLFMWKEGTVRDSLVKGVSEETRILNPNSLVLRLKLRVHVLMEDILALIIEAHLLGDSSCRLLNTPRDAPSHAIQVIKDDARRHDLLRIWRQKTELTDESRVKKKTEHDVCVGWRVSQKWQVSSYFFIILKSPCQLLAKSHMQHRIFSWATCPSFKAVVTAETRESHSSWYHRCSAERR